MDGTRYDLVWSSAAERRRPLVSFSIFAQMLLAATVRPTHRVACTCEPVCLRAVLASLLLHAQTAPAPQPVVVPTVIAATGYPMPAPTVPAAVTVLGQDVLVPVAPTIRSICSPATRY